MTDKYNGYPADASEPEALGNTVPHEDSKREKVVDRRTLFGILGVGAAAAAGIAYFVGRGSAENNITSETLSPSPSESPSSSPEATSSATATETPSPTQEPVEPGTPSSERAKPLRSYNFANLSEFDSNKWNTLNDYDKGLTCKTFFGNNLDSDVMKILTESRADQSKELAIAWFDNVDRLFRDLCNDAQSNALFTDADGREVDAWPVLRCLADYIDVPHSNIVRGSDAKDGNQPQVTPHGYYGRLVEAAYEDHIKGKKPKEEDRIVLRVTKYAQMAPYEDPFPINDGKETNQIQVYSASYCEVQEVGDEEKDKEKDKKSYYAVIERQRQITKEDRKTGRFTVHPFPRMSYFYLTDESGYEARAIKPNITAPLNDIEQQ
ncbi:MAG: hypothetical protein Q4B27_00485 [Candidatus Saccharibacteria bacterium]|nr:hypothetical protein [Candidatus Saccharibacteria bacterium]